MHTKIVIFGPDNSGKTTLANMLEDRLNKCAWEGVRVLHSPGPVSVDEQIDFMEKNLASNSTVIFDRFPWIEESTCGRVIRNKNNFESTKWNDICKWIRRVDLFVYCFPGMEKILAWGEREQMQGVKENIWKLSKAYYYLFEMLRGMKGSLNVIQYNYADKESYKKVWEMIESEYNSRN